MIFNIYLHVFALKMIYNLMTHHSTKHSPIDSVSGKNYIESFLCINITIHDDKHQNSPQSLFITVPI